MPHPVFKLIPCFCLVAGAVLTLAGCGGGAASPPLAPSPPPPISAPPPDFSAVSGEVERHPVADMAVLVGDRDGVLYTYEKGAFRATDTVRLASASKMLTGLALWSLVESGELSEATRAGDVLGEWDGPDARADVTLGQLASFTSGLTTRASDITCAGRVRFTLSQCVGVIHDAATGEGFLGPAGTTYVYGPDHMQVAALMAQTVMGSPLRTILRDRILDPAGASAATGFADISNVRYSAASRATAQDYGRVLSALLAGELIDDTAGFARDRTQGAAFAYRPRETSGGRDWHYGFGAWIECDAVPFAASCADQPTLSSPGTRGFVPWVDLERGYWAIIAMEQETGEAIRSVGLQDLIDPLIEDALR